MDQTELAIVDELLDVAESRLGEVSPELYSQSASLLVIAKMLRMLVPQQAEVPTYDGGEALIPVSF